jgi:tetratricopeptide (TPR) repeat protein
MIAALVAQCSLAVILLSSLLLAGDASKAVQKADAALIKGDYDAAIAHYDEAIRLSPRFARPYHGRGVAYFHKRLYKKAIASCTEAIRLEPENDAAIYDRGLARWQNGEPRQAVQDFTQAIRVNPKNDSAYNGLAWALSTATRAELRDGKRAVELATKACKLTDWKSPFHLSALAAAYAEVGDFPRAIEWHKKAMASPDFPKDKLERARQRLKLYEQRKPYREVIEKK